MTTRAITSDQFSALNGFSNLYLGWGCEDEDFYIRIVDRGLTLVRVHEQLSRYRTLPHVPNYPNWFWDQAISKLDRERFPNLQQIVDKEWTCQRIYLRQFYNIRRRPFNNKLCGQASQCR